MVLVSIVWVRFIYYHSLVTFMNEWRRKAIYLKTSIRHFKTIITMLIVTSLLGHCKSKNTHMFSNFHLSSGCRGTWDFRVSYGNEILRVFY